MRRFWKSVGREQGTYGYGIRLDGRALKTPMRNELYLPTKALADAVVAEWEGVAEEIDPAAMPMTGFANAAIDHVAPDRAAFAASIAECRAATSSTYSPVFFQSTTWTCQPYASYRACTSSVKATFVSSSIEIWFES